MLKEKIKDIFCYHKKRYGRIRIHKTFRQDNILVSEKIEGSIMKEMKLVALSKHAYRAKTTTPGFSGQKSLFKYNNQFTEPNQYLVGDIAYVATKEGWLYLAGFMNGYSKLIKGYSISDEIPTA